MCSNHAVRVRVRTVNPAWSATHTTHQPMFGFEGLHKMLQVASLTMLHASAAVSVTDGCLSFCRLRLGLDCITCCPGYIGTAPRGPAALFALPCEPDSRTNVVGLDASPRIQLDASCVSCGVSYCYGGLVGQRL